MAHGETKDDVIDHVTWSWKFKVMTPISLMHVISKMARERLGYNAAPVGNGTRGIDWSRDRW